MAIKPENLNKLHKTGKELRVSFQNHILTHSDQNLHDDCTLCSDFRRKQAAIGTEIKSLLDYIKTHTN